MNKKWQPIIQKVLILFIILAFIATLPATFQNSIRGDQAEEEVIKILNISKKICDSGCTDYPPDWVTSGHQADAELYCMRQCKDNMKGIRENLLNDGFPVLFTNEYNYRVAQIYCVLGLKCPQLEIKKLIEDY